MAKAPKLNSQPQIVTANDLASGDVVYLTATADWSRNIADAAVLANAAAGAGQLALAEAQARQNLIVAPYLVPVVPGSTSPRPVQFRELIRAEGPTTESRLAPAPARSAA